MERTIIRNPILIGLLCMFLLLFPAKNIWAQGEYNYQVTYQMFLHFDELKEYQADLYIGPATSLFVYGMKQKDVTDGLISNDSLESAFTFLLSDTMRYSIFTDRPNNRILHLEQIPGDGQYCIVREELPNINWEYTGNSKMIRDFHCKEAIGWFMGRHYTVWFTEQIPAAFGPWKLHGLPGLPMEVFDQSREVYFMVSRIKDMDTGVVPFDPMMSGSFEILERSEYNRRFKTYLDRLQRQLMTKFDRGFEVKVQSTFIKTIEIYDQ